MSDSRQFDISIDLAASPEEVWNALTDARHLERWFPLTAEVRPGVGGEVRWRWEAPYDWTTRIEAWEPGRRLLLHQPAARPFDVDGRPIEGAEIPARTIAIEFRLEKNGGACRLRLVHSGFGPGAAWDEELASISHGWQAELRSLRHYLARHPGEPRRAVHAFRMLPSRSPADALARLTSADAFEIDVTTVAAGLPWAVRTPWGETIFGEVLLAMPTGELLGTAREYRDGLLRLHAWKAGDRTSVGVWLSGWGGEAELADRVTEFERRAGEALVRLFPESV
jgi:uncharacterized protein YndB with AHSA1/START domain